jgi:hypothetical protein
MQNAIALSAHLADRLFAGIAGRWTGVASTSGQRSGT